MGILRGEWKEQKLTSTIYTPCHVSRRHHSRVSVPVAVCRRQRAQPPPISSRHMPILPPIPPSPGSRYPRPAAAHRLHRHSSSPKHTFIVRAVRLAVKAHASHLRAQTRVLVHVRWTNSSDTCGVGGKRDLALLLIAGVFEALVAVSAAGGGDAFRHGGGCA